MAFTVLVILFSSYGLFKDLDNEVVLFSLTPFSCREKICFREEYQAMGLKQEQFIFEFHAAWGDGTLETKPDIEKILSMMSEDAEWQQWVPGGPVIRGRAALREELMRQTRIATNNKCNIVNVLSSDTMVMQERSDTAVIFGKFCPHQMVAIYELDENGLIRRWREYLDMADLTRKMGVDEKAAAYAG